MAALGLARRKLSRLFLLLRWIVADFLLPRWPFIAKSYDMVNNQILVLQAVNREVKWVAIVVTSQLRSGSLLVSDHLMAILVHKSTNSNTTPLPCAYPLLSQQAA
ncbi:hypothetical protein HDV63DRAFT_377153 [Trichoderma sp. SZMC 28014]